MADDRGDKIDDLGARFIKLNSSFVRFIMEHHHTKVECETSQGKITRIKCEAQNKE